MALVAACSGGRSDSVGTSLGAAEGGTEEDAGSGAEDAGNEPANEPDASTQEPDDAGEPDAAETEAGEPDAETDAGEPDASGDAGLPDCDEAEAIEVAVTVELTADDFIDGVYINGQMLLYSNPGSAWPTAKVVTETVSSYAGARITIGITARNAQNQPGLDRGLIADIRVGQHVLVTDGSWRVSEQNDADWSTSAFDDSAWQSVVVLGAFGVQPWGAVGGIAANASWIWSYDPSNAPDRPTDETLYFRKTLVTNADGELLDAPTCLPRPNF